MSHCKELKFLSELEKSLGPITTKKAIQLFSENCEDFAKKLSNGEIQQVTVDEIGEGKGFCSRVFRISIELVDQKFTVVVKVPTYEHFSVMCGEKVDPTQSRNLVVEVHNCECNAYELLKKLKNIPTPKIYYVEKADDKSLGFLILEDVEASATLEQCKDLIRAIVNFQTQVNFIEDQSWRHNFLKNYQAKDFVDKLFKKIILSALEYEDKELVNGVRKYCDLDLKKLAKFAIEEFSDYDSILCHTDMWANNLFIKLNSDGTFSNSICSILDWQASRNPLYDVCCFILLCSDEKIRQKSEYDLVNFYYDELCENYSKHNGAKPTFTREKAHEFYKIAFVSLIVPLILTFSLHGVPNINSQDVENREKATTLGRRLKAALKEVESIWDKYDLAEKCKLESTLTIST